MKTLSFLLLIFLRTGMALAQSSPASVEQAKANVSAEDPSQFITRMELFSELQQVEQAATKFYLSQTTFRSVIKIGKRFTTRLDLPYVYNSFPSESNDPKSGLGDISFRLLGYKIIESQKSAITVSMEISMNTAQTRYQGTGKTYFFL